MLDFLTSLFGPAHGPDETLQEGLLGAAIERAVDKTDHRLRALGGYRKRLREPVERALRHVIGLVDQLPEPIEISPNHSSWIVWMANTACCTRNCHRAKAHVQRYPYIGQLPMLPVLGGLGVILRKRKKLS